VRTPVDMKGIANLEDTIAAAVEEKIILTKTIGFGNLWIHQISNFVKEIF